MFFLTVLGFELRVSCLLGRLSTTFQLEETEETQQETEWADWSPGSWWKFREKMGLPEYFPMQEVPGKRS
jgi:hypothetical protein